MLLIILGALQYRWSTQIKKVSEIRIGADLESVMIKWHLDFYGEFSNVCAVLQIGPDSGERDSWEDYLHRFTQWGRLGSEFNSADHLYTNRDIVSEIYIWETSKRVNPALFRLDSEKEAIVSANAPTNLEPLLKHLRDNSANLRIALNAWKFESSNRNHPGLEGPPSPSYSLRSNAETGWQFDQSIPALVHPIYHYTHHGAVDTNALSSSDPVDWVVVVLNFDTIQRRILPGLMQRYFASNQRLEYKLAVIAEGNRARVLYSSDPGFGSRAENDSDSVMNIFGPPPVGLSSDLVHVENASSLNGEDWHRFSGPVWFPVIQTTSSDGPWALVLQHREGRLDAPVTKVWRSNLFTGGVVLLLLAASMVLVVVASQHAQKLASLQMDFVASVSHELRTPLAVILSAGENVRDGLPDGRQAFMEQGSVITEQATQLMELVEQVLRFASTAKAAEFQGRCTFQVSDLVDSALRNTSDLVQRSGFVVDRQISESLPPVTADLAGLIQSLQNLIANAVKYGNENRWIGISAHLDIETDGRREIRISIADRGIGIASSELPQIFAPFYRSPRAIATQARGTGLGLSIAKSNVEASGGRLSVVSEVGVGSVFTIHLPVVEDSSKPESPIAEVNARVDA